MLCWDRRRPFVRIKRMRAVAVARSKTISTTIAAANAEDKTDVDERRLGDGMPVSGR